VGTVVVSFSNQYDPSATAAQRGYLYSYDFGNKGSFDIVNSGLSTVTVPVQYLSHDGTVTVRARIANQAAPGDNNPQDVGFSEYLTTFTVNEVAPTLQVSGAASVAVGSTYTLTLGAKDPGNDPVSHWTVNWQDGVVQELDGSVTSVNHQYLKAGNLAITATAVLENTSYTATQNVTVNDVPPVLQNLQAAPVNEGEITYLTGLIFKPGLAENYTVTVNWGDNSQATVYQVPTGNNSFNLSHFYQGLPEQGNNYVISASVSDGNVSTNAQTTAQINNVAPQINNLKLDESQNNGYRTSTLTGSYSDPGTLETYSATVNWGDGSSSAAVIDAVHRTFTATHTYTLTSLTDNFEINVTVSDGKDSSSAQVTSMGTQVSTPPQFVSTPNTVLTVPDVTVAPQDRVFKVAGAPGSLTTTSFSLSAADAGKYEVGIYQVDDSKGAIAGLLPGDSGYAAAALAAGRATTLFNVNSVVGSTIQLNLAAGNLYGFYLIVSPKQVDAIGVSPSVAAPTGSNVFFSFEGVNPGAYDQLQAQLSSGQLQFNWDSVVFAADHNFSHLQFTTTGFDTGGQGLFSYTAKADDLNGYPVIYKLLQAPDGATIDAQSGVLNYQAAIGSYDFVIEANDGHNRALQSFQLQVVPESAIKADTVASLVGLQNGFHVRLDHALDPTQFNMANAAANLKLIGATTGAVTGSILLDADLAGFTFVSASGILAGDQYTLALKASADGFVQGADFQGSFTLPKPSTQTSLYINGFTAVAGNSVNGLSVSLTSVTAVTSVRFSLRYDPSLLTISGASLPSNLQSIGRLTVNLTSPGVALFTMSFSKALPAGTTTLLNLNASVPKTATAGAMQQLQITDISVSNNTTVLSSGGIEKVSGATLLMKTGQPLANSAVTAIATPSADVLNELVSEAKQIWVSSMKMDQTALNSLAGVKVQFADLADGVLGTEQDGLIQISRSAAGYGWFADTTPAGLAEFKYSASQNEWFAVPGSDAAGKMDLLTVVEHEIGHALGLGDQTPGIGQADVMQDTLQAGIRIEPKAYKPTQDILVFDDETGDFVPVGSNPQIQVMVDEFLLMNDQVHASVPGSLYVLEEDHGVLTAIDKQLTASTSSGWLTYVRNALSQFNWG